MLPFGEESALLAKVFFFQSIPKNLQSYTV